MILGVAQPINAFFRCHPNGEGGRLVKCGCTGRRARVLWEILHKNAGRCALVLGAVNIVLGLGIVIVPLPWLIFTAFSMLLVYGMCFAVGIALVVKFRTAAPPAAFSHPHFIRVLEVLTCTCSSGSQNSNNKHSVELTETPDPELES